MPAPPRVAVATLGTYLLSALLAGAASLLVLFGPATPTVTTPLPAWAIILVLTVAFAFGEQLLLNVEFRQETHSITLSSLPLVVGLLLAPLPHVVVARVVGAGLALVLQRVRAEKTAYNVSAWAFEAALATVLVHLALGGLGRLGSIGEFGPLDAAVVLGVVVACDQLMGWLVLLVIRLHEPVGRADVRGVLLPGFVVAVVSTTMSIGVLLLVRTGVLGGIVFVVFALALLVLYRGYVHATRRHQRLEQIHRFVTGHLDTHSLAGVAESSLGEVRSLLRAGSASLLVLHDDSLADGRGQGGRGQAAGSRAIMFTVDDDGTFTVDDSGHPLHWTAIRAIDHNEPLLAPRATKDPAVRNWLAATGQRDAVVVPLPGGGGLVGTLTVANRLGEAETFTTEDLTLLQTLTGHLVVAGGSATLVERLAYEATHDALTGLFNRAHLSRLVEAADPSAAACVIMLDLNRFKEVNDRLGHRAGDVLLQVVATRLCAELSERECTIARLGGDEFAVHVPGVRHEDAAREIGVALAGAVARPAAIDEAMLVPDVSIGIALVTPDCSGTDLMRNADTAMYHAKDAKNLDVPVCVYQPDMDRGRIENLALLADLRTTLRDRPEQIAVWFQPKVDLRTRAVVSAEALVRWNHPTRGLVEPDRFIALAETAGLIEHFTPLVLAAALDECRRWHESGVPISVAVNLSARNVGDPMLPDRIAQALEDAGLPGSALILEITESSIIADPEATLPVLERLAASGLTISLDDFGTGYSSLSYLQRLPVQEVKIDRSFVSGLAGTNPGASRALVTGIAGLAANLGLRVVAEGVETAELMDDLHAMGCSIAQGYHISRPLPPADFAAWLAQHARGVAPLVTAEEPPPLRLVVAD